MRDLIERAREFYANYDFSNGHPSVPTMMTDFALEVREERDAEMKRLTSTLESVEYELSHGDWISGGMTRFSVKDGLLKQVREALGK